MRTRRRFGRGGQNRVRPSAMRRGVRTLGLVLGTGLAALGAWMGLGTDGAPVVARNTPLVGTQITARAGEDALLIVDGDTLRIRNVTIRLAGIDAPERGQPCEDAQGQPFDAGRLAAETLVSLTLSSEVRCTVLERDRYGRTVARCEAQGQDVGRAMVERGWAFPNRHAGLDYTAQGLLARAGGRGLYAGRCTLPESWRRQQAG